MSDVVSTGILLIAVWAVVIFIRSVFRSTTEHKSEHEYCVRTVEKAIDLIKRAIDLEEKGKTVDAQKDKARLQEAIREGQAVPKKYQKQALKNIELAKQSLEGAKQHRISLLEQRLKELEDGRAALRNNQDLNYEVIRVMAQFSISAACDQIGIDINSVL